MPESQKCIKLPVKLLCLSLAIFCFFAYSLEIRAALVKKILIIIPAENYRDEELNMLKAELEASGAEVKIASTTFGEVTGMSGGTVKPDILLSSVDPLQFDALVFIGGVGTEQYFNDPTAHQLARTALNNNRIVAAISIAPVILANAGLLEGKRVAVIPSEGNALMAKGVKYTGRPLERDGNIITAAASSAAADFGSEIIAALNQ